MILVHHSSPILQYIICVEDITHKTGLTLGTLAQNNEVTGSAFRPWDNSSRTSEDLTSTHSMCFFPTCQVRVVRFYVSCLLLLSSHLLLLLLNRDPRPQWSLSDLNHDHPSQCSLPDLNHDHPRPVFPAGPQPRPSPPVFPAGPQPRVSPPSVPCRTSTTTIHAQCSLPDLNRDIHAKCSLPDLNLGPSQLSAHRPSQLSVQRWTSTAR